MDSSSSYLSRYLSASRSSDAWVFDIDAFSRALMASMASMALSPTDICGVGSSKAKSTSMTSSSTADVGDPGSSNACDARVPTSPSLAGSVSSSIRTSNASSSSSDASDASEPYSISGSELAALPSSSSPPVMLPTTALSGRSLDVDADVLAASALALAASAASVGADGEDEDDAALVLTLTGLAASGLRPPPSLPFDPSGGSLEAPPILGRGPPRDASGFARVIVAGRPGGVFGDGLEKSSSSSSSSMISSSKPRSPIAPTRSVHEMGTQRNNSYGSTLGLGRDVRFIFREDSTARGTRAAVLKMRCYNMTTVPCGCLQRRRPRRARRARARHGSPAHPRRVKRKYKRKKYP